MFGRGYLSWRRDCGILYNVHSQLPFCLKRRLDCDCNLFCHGTNTLDAHTNSRSKISFTRTISKKEAQWCSEARFPMLTSHPAYPAYYDIQSLLLELLLDR